MNKAYKIEVIMSPSCDPEDAKAPYFWCILSVLTDNPKSDWCLDAAGWAKSPHEAWAEAESFYKQYINCEGD